MQLARRDPQRGAAVATGERKSEWRQRPVRRLPPFWRTTEPTISLPVPPPEARRPGVRGLPCAGCAERV